MLIRSIERPLLSCMGIACAITFSACSSSDASTAEPSPSGTCVRDSYDSTECIDTSGVNVPSMPENGGKEDIWGKSTDKFDKYVDGLLKEKYGPLSSDLALAGQQTVQWRKALHVSLTESDPLGLGLYYGSHSDWTPPAEASHPMRETDCVTWSIEVLAVAFAEAGQSSQWNSMVKPIVDAHSDGTVIARLLQERGWTIVYFNPDTQHPYDGADDWPDNYRIAKSGGGYNARYGGPKKVDALIVDYAPNPKYPKEPNTTAYEKLKAVPFFFGVVEGGMHAFVGYNDVVSEMHWAATGTTAGIIEETHLNEWYSDLSDRRYGWGDGIIAIPPGAWK